MTPIGRIKRAGKEGADDVLDESAAMIIRAFSWQYVCRHAKMSLELRLEMTLMRSLLKSEKMGGRWKEHSGRGHLESTLVGS